jgi:hypothetical protein
MSDIVRLQRGALTQPVAGEAAAKIHLSDPAETIAKRIKDRDMLEVALVAKLEGQRDFAAEYVSKFPHGGQAGNTNAAKNEDDRPVVSVLTKGTPAETWCRTFGFNIRMVQRWLVFLDSAEFEIKRAEITKKCWEYAELWSNVRGTQNTGDFEWFTPPKYVEAVRAVFGDGIDLDPASNVEAQKTVCGKRFFTKEEDGLAQEWHGKVFLNPPYAQPHIDLFIEKLVTEYTAGRVIAAIMLTHNYSDTAWHNRAFAHASAICSTVGRIKFVNIDGSTGSPTQGQDFFYFGADAERFEEVFCKIGNCSRPSRRYEGACGQVEQAGGNEVEPATFADGATSPTRRLSPHPAPRARRRPHRSTGRSSRSVRFVSSFARWRNG